MDKIAQLKHAEVAGVISGLIDGGYLKLASDQEFEALTEAVAGSISNNWDLGEVLDKTAEIMDGGMDKTAEEEAYEALADYGYLCLAKEAGAISEVEFDKIAADGALTSKIMNWLSKADVAAGNAITSDKAMNFYNKVREAKDFVTRAGSFKDFNRARELAKAYKNTQYDSKMRILKSLKDPAKLYGGAAAGTAGLYGLNKLRDKDNRDAIARKFKAGKKAILG